ncbi:MAG TPA: hypothetical protein VGF45_09265 [Polyangia bacterium]
MSPCAVLTGVNAPDTVKVALHVPEGTKLKNAMITGAAARACQSGVPVETVAVDGEDVTQGPAALKPNSQLTLLFPFTPLWSRPLAVTPPVVLDLDLATPSSHQCLRVPIPINERQSQWKRYLSELSLRRKERGEP